MKNTVKIGDDVRAVLEAAQTDGPLLKLTGQLDRPLYVKTNKVLALLGGKWNRGKAAHVFQDDAGALIREALGSGEVLDKKKAFQFFETPTDVAQQMVDIAEIRPGMRVLEPSAGNGRIAEILAAAVGHKRDVDVCEIQEGLRLVLAAQAYNIVGHDFLELTQGGYDRIVANPPFTGGQDIEHVGHMWELLAPGGRLVSITATGWTFRTDKKHVRFQDFFTVSGGRKVDLPAGTFKASGTGVASVLVVLDKAIEAKEERCMQPSSGEEE